MIKISTLKDEYLLSVPYSEKSRAKSIAGYKWDQKEKVWRYPKTDSVLKAFLSEFGPEEVVLLDSGFIDSVGTLLEESEAEKKKAEAELERHGERIQRMEETIAKYEALLDIWNSAVEHGLPIEAELDSLVSFTKAAYQGNSHQASLAAELALTTAKLNEARRELSDTIDEGKHGGKKHFYETLILHVWGHGMVPQVVQEYSFDAQGVIVLQNFLHGLLLQELGRRGQKVAFADLIREAEDLGVLCNSATRVCHTLRIQRNHFAHEDVPPEDVFPRAALCLISFSLVYRELIKRRGL